jgi:hypothetical protein
LPCQRNIRTHKNLSSYTRNGIPGRPGRRSCGVFCTCTNWGLAGNPCRAAFLAYGRINIITRRRMQTPGNLTPLAIRSHHDVERRAFAASLQVCRMPIRLSGFSTSATSATSLRRAVERLTRRLPQSLLLPFHRMPLHLHLDSEVQRPALSLGS